MIDTIAVRPGTNGVEVYAFLVGATVFKTDETEVLGLAGSIPVHLRHRPRFRPQHAHVRFSFSRLTWSFHATDG